MEKTSSDDFTGGIADENLGPLSLFGDASDCLMVSDVAQEVEIESNENYVSCINGSESIVVEPTVDKKRPAVDDDVSKIQNKCSRFMVVVSKLPSSPFEEPVKNLEEWHSETHGGSSEYNESIAFKRITQSFDSQTLLSTRKSGPSICISEIYKGGFTYRLMSRESSRSRCDMCFPLPAPHKGCNMSGLPVVHFRGVLHDPRMCIQGNSVPMIYHNMEKIRDILIYLFHTVPYNKHGIVRENVRLYYLANTGGKKYKLYYVMYSPIVECIILFFQCTRIFAAIDINPAAKLAKLTECIYYECITSPRNFMDDCITVCKLCKTMTNSLCTLNMGKFESKRLKIVNGDSICIHIDVTTTLISKMMKFVPNSDTFRDSLECLLDKLDVTEKYIFLFLYNVFRINIEGYAWIIGESDEADLYFANIIIINIHNMGDLVSIIESFAKMTYNILTKYVSKYFVSESFEQFKFVELYRHFFFSFVFRYLPLYIPIVVTSNTTVSVKIISLCKLFIDLDVVSLNLIPIDTYIYFVNQHPCNTYNQNVVTSTYKLSILYSDNFVHKMR